MEKPEDKKVRKEGAIAFMARNSIAANLLMIILIGGGIWTMFNIQKEVFPQFQLDYVEVNVVYPGAAPAEVEQGILLPVEEAIRGIQGIKEITSTANEGSGNILIELVAGTDRMQAFQDIDQGVRRIQTFPDDIERPQVNLQARQRDVMEIAIYGESDIWTLRILAERLRNRLLGDPQITQVEIGNVPDYVTHIEIPRHNLRQYNLTLGQVANIVAQSSEDVPAGAVETHSGEILLRMKERKQWAKEFGNITIVSSPSGARVSLQDIATITDGFEETGFHGQFNQSPSVDLSIYRIGDQSPLDIEETVLEIMEDFQLPPGVQFRIDSNSAEDYRERLSLLTENGIMAIVIVLVILALFLEYRLAFWVMMGMAISFIGGIIFLPLFGLSINMISMFGFLVVLGIVVDDAIVVGENIHEYRQKGLSAIDAAIAGTKDVSKPVIFSILTTIIAFVPLLFMPGETGKFWWPLPAVVIVILAVSLLEALFILPSHLGHLKEKKTKGWTARLEKLQESFAKGYERIIDKYYRPLLDLCLKYRYITLSAAIALLLIVGGYGYSDHMGMIMMPEVAADEIEAGVRLPVSTTPEQAARVAEEITESTRRMFEEHNLYEVAEGVKTNVRGQNFIDVEIVMLPPDERDMSARELIALWRDNIGDIAGVDQITFEAERGPGGYQQDISVDLSHADINVLEKASKTFLEQMEAFENTRDLNDNYDKGKIQYDFKLLPEGRNLGLTSNEVGRQVRDAFFGALAMRQLRSTNEIEVRVKLPLEERRDIDNLESFLVRTPNGVEVPLLDVVEVEQREAFTSINRRDGRRVVNVGMDVEPANAVTQVLASVQNEVLPQLRADYPGLTWSFEGSQADMRESTNSLWSGFSMAMLIIYALLAIAFSSYSQPIIVLSAIPFGIVGAVIGHILLGYDLSVVSLMGVIALSGVVVNDSLIMIDYANKQRETSSVYEAIHEAGLRRFRPIMLTTLTTFGGLTPIILETSSQAEYLIPMAISLGFGIVFATSIILVIVPCLYLVLEDVSLLIKEGRIVKRKAEVTKA
ncbi:efflux RND transporter permease subunit [Salegentibacter mishustinae]|uniref:Multidrug transporter n=1 Tax=Salegentibacter mishustinae TaxID=270918 RepID=A0A0Q9ZHF0_9FLAO|nr:efflux RND transporter permease subunit [Salegentibacter mishustinae]KRG28273.1 multidrug transporter [Salegentibacter mishustinae]PNW22208.1 multidrug transporter [Salegentibacter mishustinae]PZX67427.1 multidrug efflux pump subunit AcrB [Salegentibacter mishustinae]GGW79807.1 multidrug resistance protein [Salegentibacter mishustinae]